MNNLPIGVFDSGLGGLSAARELRRLMPKEKIIYFGDSARIPYGTRSTQTIKRYALQDAAFLKSMNVKAILIACGTVSSTAMEYLKENIDVPIVGVVEPTVKRALQLSKNKKIGVLGTGATVKSGAYIKELYRQCADPQLQVTQVACPLLVPLVENGYCDFENKITRLVLSEYLKSIKESGADTLILGCTHYPLIADMILDEWGGGITINSGKQAAKGLKELLESCDLLCAEDQGAIELYSSDEMVNFSEQAKIFLQNEEAVYMSTKINIEQY